MQPLIIVAIVVFSLIVVGLVVLLAATQRKARTVAAPDVAGKYPQGHWLGIGLASGMLFGYLLALLLGIITGNMALFIIFGPTTGMLLGLAIGAALEQQHKDEMRPLTAAERQSRQRAALAGGVVLILGLMAFAGVLLLTAS